jgi:methionyl-tRNA formyltransferase
MIGSSIVIGSSSITFGCARLLKQRGQRVQLIEPVNKRSNYLISLASLCIKNNIKYSKLTKEQITCQLLSIDNSTLIISASNQYIFPRDVIENNHLTIINYHGAILPKHPGRNAESWTIYEGDEIGGITWHLVTEQIDAGDIIIQKIIPITPDITSINLLKIYGDLAINGLDEILDSLLSNKYPRLKQNPNQREIIKLSKQIPNNGELILTWDSQTVSRFLRSFDYGAYYTLGLPFISHCNDRLKISKYKIVYSEDIKSYKDFFLVSDALSYAVLKRNELLFLLSFMNHE